MKRICSLLLVVALSTLGFSYAQKSQTGDEVFNPLKYNVVKAYHWSLGATAGISVFDGDQTQDANMIVPRSKPKFAMGANLEYTFTPQWGIFLQYMYAPFSGNTSQKTLPTDIGTPLDFRGTSHYASLNLSLNILNLLYNYRPQTWNWYLNAGAGVNFYNSAAYEPDTDNPLTEDTNGNAVNFDIKDGRGIFIPIGTTVEYSPLKWLAIVLDVQYRMNTKDNIDLQASGQYNDNILYTGLGLRWKMVGRKDKMHVRNMSKGMYEPEAGLVVAQNAAEMAEKAAIKADETAMKADEVAEKQESMQSNVDFLMANAAGEDDSDQDGVPDNRDREPNTPTNSYVNYYGEALNSQKVNEILGESGMPVVPSIFYDLGSTQIKPYDQSTLANVARTLNDNKNLKLEIRGYADNVGGANANKSMSLKRAESARNELVKVYGVDPNRINVVGMGEVNSDKENYLPNRRCEFIIK